MPGEGLVDGDVSPDTNPPPPPPPPPPVAPVGALRPSVQGDGDAAASLAARLASLEEKLAQAVAALERLERLREIERALRSAGAADVALAMPIVERDIAEAPQRDVSETVAELRKRRPGLFVGGTRTAGATGAPSSGGEPRAEDLAALALRAASGDPRAVRDYLRARREA
ncbi:MAG: hypothetical protein ACKVS8_09180 [Phycisphaerales bacterium]